MEVVMKEIPVIETITLQPSPKPKTVFGQSAIFKDKVYEVVFDGNQLVFLGNPPEEYEDDNEDTHHNCDEMGCGWHHVLMRVYVGSIENIHCDIPTRLKITPKG
jgi:hypothetical protein